MKHAVFEVPPGAVATVRIIDSTSRIGKLPVEFLMEPAVSGFQYMPELPSWSFMIESPDGRTALFDLGIPKDWQNMAPKVADQLKVRGWEIEVQKNVSEILAANSYKTSSIHSIIWSHWHWDHLGDPSTFPETTELVVGPGFQTNFMPGYPADRDGVVRESDFRGRNVRELDFEGGDALVVGDFRAIDFFGDGSFYILDAPGHAVGHICGLARTSSNPETFIFMGGDLCHHGGEMRPSKYVPLPNIVSPNPFESAQRQTCPGQLFEAVQKHRGRSGDQPFFDPAMGFSIAEAVDSIRRAQKADANANVLFIYAHDTSVGKVATLFPDKANDWHRHGWRERMFWAFLEDFKGALVE